MVESVDGAVEGDAGRDLDGLGGLEETEPLGRGCAGEQATDKAQQYRRQRYEDTHNT